MRKRIVDAIPFIFLLLAVGFVGGMETAENMTVPGIGALVCLVIAAIGFYANRDSKDYIEEDEEQ